MKRRRSGFVAGMNTSIDALRNGAFFHNNGGIAFVIIRMYFVPLLVWNKFALRMEKD
jgi:hypothetical protein